MSKVHKTEKGTLLPLLNLKGKDYLMVGYRMVWFREVHPLGRMETEVVELKETHAIFKATIFVPNEKGEYVKLATATKREDAKHFPDFLEKAETGALGRALALSGFGTQFSLPEFEENNRLADAPLESVKKVDIAVAYADASLKVSELVQEKEEPKKASSFRKTKAAPVITPEQENEWGT